MAKTTQQPKAIPMSSAVVVSMPAPPNRKAEDYLASYNGYVYSAVSSIAQEVASIDLHLYTIKHTPKGIVTDEIFEHEFLSLLGHINPLFTFYDLVENTQVYLELVGEAFWVILKDPSGTPREIWPLRPDWVNVIPSADKIIDHYEYRPGGYMNEKISLPAENVIHFKYVNPLNPYRGKGSVQAAALPIDIHQFSQEWNRTFFFNNATPGLVFTTDKNLSEPVLKRFAQQWQDTYAGRSKAYKTAFLAGGFKVEKTMSGTRDMDFSEQQRIMRDDILAVFKVPKTVLGLSEDVNRANAEATTAAFMERVITPRMKKFVGALQEHLVQMYKDGPKLMLDFTDPAPEDVDQKLKIYENASKYGWMTPNEIRANENLDPIEGGDDLPSKEAKPNPNEDEDMGDETDDSKKPKDDKDKKDDKKNGKLTEGLMKLLGLKRVEKKTFVSKAKKMAVKHMMPFPAKRLEVLQEEKLTTELTKDLTKLIGEMLKAKDAGDEKDDKPTIKTLTAEEKDEYWLNFIDKANRDEVQYKKRVLTLFNEQEAEVLANIETHKHLSKDMRKGMVDDFLFDLKEWVNNWVGALLPWLRDLIIQRGEEMLESLGSAVGFDSTTATMAEFLERDATAFMKEINVTTRDSLKETLAEGVKNNENTSQLKDRVRKVYKQASKNRAGTIARMEVLRASNFASVEAYTQSDVVTAKEWLSERDSQVCPFCAEMDGKTVAVTSLYFEKGDTFKVDGKEMKIDITNIGYPPLHTNCRCTTIPVVTGSKEQYETNEKIKNLQDDILRRELANIGKDAKKVLTQAQEEADVLLKKAEAEIKEKELQVIKEAEEKAKRVISSANKKAKEKLEEVVGKDLLLTKKEKEVERINNSAIEGAKIKVQEIMLNAKKESKLILDQALEEKKTLLGEIKKLRDKARNLIYGKE